MSDITNPFETEPGLCVGKYGIGSGRSITIVTTKVRGQYEFCLEDGLRLTVFQDDDGILRLSMRTNRISGVPLDWLVEVHNAAKFLAWDCGSKFDRPVVNVPLPTGPELT